MPTTKQPHCTGGAGPSQKEYTVTSSAKRHRFWIRFAGVGLALLVPAAVVAATVQFSRGEVLSAEKLNELSARTLDKSLVYQAPAGALTIEQGDQATVTSTCADVEDILLNCSCLGGPGSLAIDLRVINVTNNSATALNARATCTCSGVNVAAQPRVITAQATCINLPAP